MHPMKTTFSGVIVLFAGALMLAGSELPLHRYLYAAVPGIRDELEHGGHGLLVFDIDNGHKFIRRIPTSGLTREGKPLNVKGVCASAATRRIYITTTQTITCLDLLSETILWEKPLPGGCDRLAISPDGKTIYVPSFESTHWNVINAITGEKVAVIAPNSGAHNTVYSRDGSRVYLAGLRSRWLTVADTHSHTSNSVVGPFSASIRPFTVNAASTRAYCCVNELLGFEIGDLASGKVLARVEVNDFKKGSPKRHGCPSHGIGLTPDESEIWVCDAVNRCVHIFDNSVMPPRQKSNVVLRDEPGWVTFTIDGQFAYPSTGDVIDVAGKKVVARLTDEHGAAVQSEKVVEIDFRGAEPARAGDQFGIGRKLSMSMK